MSPIIYQPHECETPPTDVPVGSLWQCPECDKVWALDSDVGSDRVIHLWLTEADPRRYAAEQAANTRATQATKPATATVTPDMVRLALDTYSDHMVMVPNDVGFEPLGFCGECEESLQGSHTSQAHALSITAEVLQDALDKAGRP